MQTLTLSIEGMHCNGCVTRVTQALQKAGTAPETVTVGTARLQFDPAKTNPQSILQSLDKIGFTAHIAETQP